MDILSSLFGKPKDIDEQISDLEAQAQRDADVLAKVQRIAQLRAEHINAQKKIKQYRQNATNRLIFVGVLVFIVILFLARGCKI